MVRVEGLVLRLAATAGDSAGLRTRYLRAE